MPILLGGGWTQSLTAAVHQSFELRHPRALGGLAHLSAGATDSQRFACH